MSDSVKLCIDCKHYARGNDENHDICGHDKARNGGVRGFSYYPCVAMRAGICGKTADLFEPKSADDSTVPY